MRTVAIIGCGLIGGSILKALATHEGYTLHALDPDPETGARIRADWPEVHVHAWPEVLNTVADASAAEDAQALRDEAPELVRALRTCALIVMAGPVAAVAPTVRFLAQITEALFTDVASIKGPICAELADLHFIGGHPMAGSERQGYVPARADMFQNAPYILVPTPLSSPEACAMLEAFATDLGAHPVRLSAAAHDRVVAHVSHLPHVAATALVLAVDRDDSDMTALSAGGFRDITRIASSNPELWTEITLEGVDALIPALDAYLEELTAFRTALATHDRAEVHTRFMEGFGRRSQLPMHGTGALAADQAVTVYLPDVPGALADITGKLAEHQISIRNLSIQNARTYEGGQLRIYIADGATADRCRSVLREQGYVCE